MGLLTLCISILIFDLGCQSTAKTEPIANHHVPNSNEFHADPASDRIWVFIGGINAPLLGRYYIKQGTTLESVLEWSGVRNSFAPKVEVYTKNNVKISYRFKNVSKAELESVVLHEGDKIVFPETIF